MILVGLHSGSKISKMIRRDRNVNKINVMINRIINIDKDRSVIILFGILYLDRKYFICY
jgi:hypothetical protein